MTDAPLAYGPPVTLAYAQALAAAAVAECDRLGLPMVIVVTEPSGDLVLVHKMDQAQYGSTDVAIGKAKTASRFRRPTSVMAAVVKAAPIRVTNMTGFFTIRRGSSFLNDPPMAGRMMFQSRSEGVLAL